MDLGDLMTNMGNTLMPKPRQGGAFGVLSPGEQAEVPPNLVDQFVSRTVNDLASLPKRAIDAAAEDSQHLGDPRDAAEQHHRNDGRRTQATGELARPPLMARGHRLALLRRCQPSVFSVPAAASCWPRF